MVVDQLTYDPKFGNVRPARHADGPVVLAWGREPVLDVSVEGQTAAAAQQRPLLRAGRACRSRAGRPSSGDLLQHDDHRHGRGFFCKDPTSINFGRGSATVAYRPIAVRRARSTVEPRPVRLQLRAGRRSRRGTIEDRIAPIPDACLTVKDGDPLPDGCPTALPADQFDGMPEVEVFDRTAQHVAPAAAPRRRAARTTSPTRRATSTRPPARVLVRFVNDRQDQVGFSVSTSRSTGTVR